MDNFAGHWGWIGLGAIHMLLFWGLIILAIVVLIRLLVQDKTSDKSDSQPLAILKARYARGEINKEEYEQKKKDLIEH